MIVHYEEFDQPLLVKLAKKDWIAALNTLVSLKRETKSCNTISALHYLSWEADNTSFLYDRVDMNTFLYSLRDSDTLFAKSELRSRIAKAYGTQSRFEMYKIRTLVIFKHFIEHKHINQ